MSAAPRLEAVYYSSPMPRSIAVLTVLGLVFDRIHLPFVSLPDDGWTQDELTERAEKLLAIDESQRSPDFYTMLAAIQFTRWKEWTKDFLYYPHDGQEIWALTHKIPMPLVQEIYDLTFPPRPNFIPSFDSGVYFSAVPNLQRASVGYAGTFHYPAGALMYAAEQGLPIINDIPMLGMPQVEIGALKNNTAGLASMLAVECIKMALPQVPVLGITELLDFREEMTPHVRDFRLALLNAAKSLNAQIVAGIDADELGEAVRFVVETEIAPLIADLRAYAESPARPFHKRILDLGRPLVAMMSGEFWAMPPGTQLARVAQGYAAQAVGSLVSERQKQEAVRRSNMFYLLQVEQLGKKP